MVLPANTFCLCFSHSFKSDRHTHFNPAQLVLFGVKLHRFNPRKQLGPMSSYWESIGFSTIANIISNITILVKANKIQWGWN